MLGAWHRVLGVDKAQVLKALPAQRQCTPSLGPGWGPAVTHAPAAGVLLSCGDTEALEHPERRLKGRWWNAPSPLNPCRLVAQAHRALTAPQAPEALGGGSSGGRGTACLPGMQAFWGPPTLSLLEDLEV